MIRHAILDDLPALIALGEAMHVESPQWSRLTLSTTRLRLTLEALIVSDSGVIIVAEERGELVAGIACAAQPHWSSNDLVASEMAFFVRKDYRGSITAVKLIRLMDEWAFGKGCVLLQAGCSTGIDDGRVAALYQHLGFTPSAACVERFYGK